jgi:hypothetical protein
MGKSYEAQRFQTISQFSLVITIVNCKGTRNVLPH